jgi:hypothetical protein
LILPGRTRFSKREPSVPLTKKQLMWVLLVGLPLAGPEVCARSNAGPEPLLGRTALAEPDQSGTLVARGTIKTFDPVTKVLLLSTTNGTMQFTIPSAVRIRQRWHSIETSALARYLGFRVAVRYSESGVERTVQSVHVFGKDER